MNLYDLKLKMTLKESMECRTAITVVKLVRILNKEIPSSFSGRLPDLAKMVALRSPVTEDSRHLNRTLAF